MIRYWLPIVKFMACCLAVMAVSLGNAQDNRETSAACGMVIHPIPSSPTLDSFPASVRFQIKKALSNDIAAEAKETGADQDRSNTVPLDKALQLWRLSSSMTDRQLYIVLWYEQAICGAHGNCAMWLVEVKGAGARNLVASGDPKNPARTIGTGWGVGIRSNSLQPYPEIMVLAHGYRPQGGPEVEVSCKHQSGKDYVSSDCPVDCWRSLNLEN